MAFGVASKIFCSTIEDILENTTAMDLNGDTFYVALFNDSCTPDQTVASAATAFGAGVWAANEVFDGAEWATGGQELGSVTSAISTTTYKFDAADEVSAGTSATLADVRGCLIYDQTIAAPVADQGVCFLSFGGANAVTDGTFTVVFNAAGIFTIAM